MSLCGLLLTISCKNQESPSTETADDVELPDDFFTFYEKFHRDSSFQLAHIVFPLEGLPSRDSVYTGDFTWRKEDWTLHRPFDDMGVFSRQFYNMNNIIVEKIIARQGNFDMERRFSKINEEWHLIYYKEMGR